MNKEDKELLKLQSQIITIIKEKHYSENSFLEFDDNLAASKETISKINYIFFNHLRNNGLPDIDNFLEAFKSSINKMNDNAFREKYTPRQIIKLLYTKFFGVSSYMVGGDIDGNIDKSKISEIIENFSIQ